MITRTAARLAYKDRRSLRTASFQVDTQSIELVDSFGTHRAEAPFVLFKAVHEHIATDIDNLPSSRNTSHPRGFHRPLPPKTNDRNKHFFRTIPKRSTIRSRSNIFTYEPAKLDTLQPTRSSHCDWTVFPSLVDVVSFRSAYTSPYRNRTKIVYGNCCY